MACTCLKHANARNIACSAQEVALPVAPLGMLLTYIPLAVACKAQTSHHMKCGKAVALQVPQNDTF